MANKDNIWYIVHTKWAIGFKTSQCTYVTLNEVFEIISIPIIGKDVETLVCSRSQRGKKHFLHVHAQRMVEEAASVNQLNIHTSIYVKHCRDTRGGSFYLGGENARPSNKLERLLNFASESEGISLCPYLAFTLSRTVSHLG